MLDGTLRLRGFWFLVVWAASCSSTNSSTTDAARDSSATRIPANHRATGSACPQARGAGLSDIPGCTQVGSPAGCGCTRDSDCPNGTNGRCLSAAGPAGSLYCSYDECSSDSDCSGNAPCGCRVSSASTAANTCATESNCRVDADCGPGGFCSPSQVNSICQCESASYCPPGEQPGVSCPGNCGHGYFCHTPKDSCLDDSDCGTGTCSFDMTSQAWLCVSICIGPF
jgi:hypothetical protein